jgi:folate-binding protein YgfZ
MNKLHDLSRIKSLIAFSGSDAESFLQGQTTCDVACLNAGNSVFGALCNPKGRVISLFHLFKVDGIIYMLVNTEWVDRLIKRLKMFVFRSDVQITNVSNTYVVLGSQVAISDNTRKDLQTIASVTLGDDLNLMMFIISVDTHQLISADSNYTLNSNRAHWDQLMAAECFPDITLNTSELFIPQMINLELLEGISFQKGCYTGQEVVARLHYKGSVKKRLVIYQSDKLFECGENIYLPNNQNSIGTVLNSIADTDSNFSGLIVLKTDYIQQHELILQDDTKLSIRLPKYGLD